MIRTEHPSAAPELPYLLYAPEGADVRADWPLAVFLHGSGERGADLALAAKHGLPRWLEEGGEFDGYVLVPQCPKGRQWEDVLDGLDAMVERVAGENPVAAERILLTGFSMGGYGGWSWALRDPARFAAFAPVAGSRLPGPPDALRGLPIWIFHGAADTHVPVAGADECAAALAKAGIPFGYTRYPDADHGSTSRLAYADPELRRWMGRHAAPPPNLPVRGVDHRSGASGSPPRKSSRLRSAMDVDT
jgi:predicted peptidase